jgi:hypothetical protein
MQSKAKDVTTYLQEAPAGRRPCLANLRELCLEVLNNQPVPPADTLIPGS